jgi:hypothetical protein
MYLVIRSNVRPVSIFICSLFIAAVLPILLPDLALHQSRATAARYLCPAWIAIDLAVAYALCTLSTNKRWETPMAAIAASIVLLGLVSWIVSAPSKAWWTASSEEPLLSIVRTVDGYPQAFVATGDAAMALNLSNYFPSQYRFDITAEPSVSSLATAAADGAFLIAPTPSLIARLASANLRSDIVYQSLEVDSPMLRGAGRLNFLALRRQLAAARIKAGTVAADFSVWRVSRREPDAHDDSSIISPLLGHGVFRNCDPPFGRWIDIQATSLECRPFNASSPLNRPIPPNAKLMPNSANMMKYLLTKTGSVPGELTAKCAAGIDPKCAGEHTDYGHPVYVSRKSDPLYTIHCTNPFGGTCQPEGARIHIPSNARPAGGTDHHFGVIDQTTGLEYDFWGFCYGGPPFKAGDSATDEPLTVADCNKKYGGRLQASTGAIYDLDSSGIWSAHLAGRKGMEASEIASATASGIALFGGAARVREFKDGAYPHHAGFMVLPCSNGSAVYPMSHFDTPCSEFKATNPPCSWQPEGDCGIPYGARWFIDLSDSAIDACVDGGKPCLGPVKATLKMLAHYGMFFGDTNGDYGWGLKIMTDDWADQSEFGTTPTYTYFSSQGLTERNNTGDLIVPWPSWMNVEWFAVHSHFADPCVSRGDC